MMYTTNVIVSMNSTIRKYTKTKTVFSDNNVALKEVYLVINNIERKWTNQIRNGWQIMNQFLFSVESRCLI